MTRPATRHRPVRASERIRVLVVAASPALAATLQTALLQAGMATELAASGAEALASQAAEPAAVVVVELALPDMPGAALLARLAGADESGVIAVAADAAQAAQLRRAGGADDAVGLPLAPNALIARVRALERRRRRPRPHPAPSIHVDRGASALVDAAGRRTPLSAAELAALVTLLEAEGAAVSREWLARISLRRLVHAGDRAVDELVAGLRRKLAAHGAPATTIRSARGQGYVLGDPAVFADRADD